MCVIKFLGRGSCILRWLRRCVGERLGEIRALLGELLTCRPKSVLGELFRRLAGADIDYPCPPLVVSSELTLPWLGVTECGGV